MQEELLTILEGTVVSVPKDGSNKTSGEWIEIDTTNILFIVGGAFVELGEIVSRRLASERGSSIGFGAKVEAKEEDKSRFQKLATAADFIKFGLIPELVGRLPKRLVIETLTVNQLERILVEPDKALIMQKRLLLASTTDVMFTEGAIRAIAEEAHKIGTHGRALREIVEQVLEPIVYDEPEVAIITAAMVINRNDEIEATNREDDGVKVELKRDFIVPDDKVEEARTAAVEAAQARHDQPSAPARSGPRTGRPARQPRSSYAGSGLPRLAPCHRLLELVCCLPKRGRRRRTKYGAKDGGAPYPGLLVTCIQPRSILEKVRAGRWSPCSALSLFPTSK